MQKLPRKTAVMAASGLFLLTTSVSSRAQERGIPLSPPVPIAGSTWSAQVTSWDLPPQDTAYLVQDVERLVCPLSLMIQPDGAAAADASACPPSLQEAALDAVSRWEFQPVLPDDQPALAELRFVVRFNPELGAMTLWAELDPGADNADLDGRPGLKLVRPASLTRPLQVKLKKKLVKAGVEPTGCALRARISSAGRATEVLVVDCPGTLDHDAQDRVERARFEPGSIDGSFVEDVIDVTVSYH